jgi:hypothetical protein
MSSDPNTFQSPLLQGMVPGYARPGTPGFIPMVDLPPRTGMEWAKLQGMAETEDRPIELTEEELEAQEYVEECHNMITRLETAIAENRRKASRKSVFAYTRGYEEAEPPADAEAEEIESALMSQLETAREDLKKARVHFNGLLRQRDMRDRLERQRVKDAVQADKEIEINQAREKSRVDLFKRLGIKV